MKPGERLAIIDLGSNSFRLVVFTVGEGWWKRTDEIYEPVRIGQGLMASGRLGEEPMERALATLDVFAHFLHAASLGVQQVDAVATSAIRDAENGSEFLERARAFFALPIRVLSREQEARYGYIAAVNSTTLSDGCVLDLGGGSLQLVSVAARLARDVGSWRVGTVRMSERFLPPNGPAKRKQLQELRAHVFRELEQADWLGDANDAVGGRLVGLGGTVRNLAAAAQRAAGLPSNGVQGMFIERDALDELVQRLASLPAPERASVPGVKPARADLILAGAVVVQCVLEAGGFAGIETTEEGLREGVFYERLLAERDPPLLEDVRRASVLNMAAQYRVDSEHTRHVARLALGMFDELARLGLHPGDPHERGLLWAASMLHDIGMSIDYDDHHKHSRYLILNGGLPGFSPVETAIIAQAARYHRKGMPAAGPMAPLFADGDAERLDRCATLLRLAEDLERSRDQLVRRTSIALGEDGEVQLHLIADGDSAVPRWAARRERELFARAFHRELSVAA
ncbi:MAG: exopolyphosphatase / guanosine-5-triphosphate,3-diphosphate pyrophosphatase [Solirubrobacteraceae bacterium]|jgi:exopolyphosphatase/guanosine-5'-triphosphate,3'-diphosphate pyrophosphatase|nr:exopolyphosphatase / guanosine-5-triphosphate,3-diphosphate pyrophosphatase [Solirubrobacteraceae bacterium]